MMSYLPVRELRFRAVSSIVTAVKSGGRFPEDMFFL